MRNFKFLSTPSARRATFFRSCLSLTTWNFYPRPPRGGRPPCSPFSNSSVSFLSTPSARRATVRCAYSLEHLKFLSTPSARRATFLFLFFFPLIPISIHALREEGDFFFTGKSLFVKYFYPRPPRGGRPYRLRCLPSGSIFLSTPSARRATHGVFSYSLMILISIHALREEGDDTGQRSGRFFKGISIHALREEGDLCFIVRSGGRKYFYPRPPRGGRLQNCTKKSDSKCARRINSFENCKCF